MAPPPHPNPSPPTARPEAASKPDFISAEVDGRAGSSASSTMKLRPPPKPGQSAPQAETETAGTEGSAVPSPSVGASSARVHNTSGEEATSSLDGQRQKWRRPYEIPKWSALPSQPYFVEVVKDGAVIDKIDVSRKGAYMFGRSELCDTTLMHSSISRFHAVIQFKCDGRIFLYDIGSAHGSFINDTLIEKNKYKDILVGDAIRFGESSRLYIFRGPCESMLPIVKTANGDSIQESPGTSSGKVKRDSRKANRIEEDTQSISEMEHAQIEMRGDKMELVFSARSAGFSTPQNRSLSSASDIIKRNACSVGAKRSNVSMDYTKASKCKRLLFHDSVSSKSEVTLAEFATYGMTERIKVPSMPQEVKMGKTPAKLVLLNTFGLLIDLHCKHLTLKGSYSLENFLVWLSTKQVTLCGMEPRQYSSGDDALDKAHFVRIVKAMFSADDLPIPHDIMVWLNCIDKGTNDTVLRKHIHMLHPDAVFGEFCIMYHAMLELRDLHSKKFKKLLKELAQYGTWEQVGFTWSTLQSNTKYRDPNHSEYRDPNHPEKAPTFRSSVFGLMQQYRNCWEHPAKLQKYYLLAVVLCDYPEFLSDVQVALHALGCLPHL